MKKSIISNTVILMTLLYFCTNNAESAGNEISHGKTYALIISGISKDTQDKSIRYNAVIGLQKFLLDNAIVTFEQIKILTADAADGKDDQYISKFENINKVINNFQSKINPEDRFIFYYTGQANVIGEQLRINLPDKDITQEQLSGLIKNIKSSSMLIVLDCPASGLAVKELSGAGRIIICSCTAEQRFSIKFSEFFIPALSDIETDIDKNGKISILEAFIVTTKNVQEWYQQKQLIITETPVLDDNGDGKASKEPWRFMIDVPDGKMASKYEF